MNFLLEMSTVALFAVLVGLTNVLTEVTKRVLPLKKAEGAVLFWAVSLSIAAAALRLPDSGWLTAVLGGVIGGGVVAYAAMFGYDALYERLPEAAGTFVKYLSGGGRDAEQP